MTKDKIIGIIVVIIGIILIGVGTISILTPSTNKEKNNTHENEKIPEESNSDQEIETLENAFNGIDYKNISFVEKDGKKYFKVTIHNITTNVITQQTVNITFLNSSNKKIDSLTVQLPSLVQDQTIDLEFEYTGKTIPENYKFIIEDEIVLGSG